MASQLALLPYLTTFLSLVVVTFSSVKEVVGYKIKWKLRTIAYKACTHLTLSYFFNIFCTPAVYHVWLC